MERPLSPPAALSMSRFFPAHDCLTEIMLLVDSDIPRTSEVTKKLHDFADAIFVGGPEVREKMLELGAYVLICRAWTACCFSGVIDVPSPSVGAPECRDGVLRSLYALTAGFPELIDDVGWQIISQAVDKTVPEHTQILVLKLVRNISIKSEENREYFTWTLGLLDPLLSLIAVQRPSSEFLREWCATVKAIMLSDDPRVAYNRAPERKRIIARARILPILASHLHHLEYHNDEGTLNAIIILLGSMAVNDEVCIQIEAGNVLPAFHSIFKTHVHNKTLIRNAVSLLRYLCTNQLCREKSSGYNLMKWVVELIQYYKKEADVVDVGISCCAFMTLKNACNTSQFTGKNGLNILYQIMKEHSEDITILKGACLTLRNVCENGGDEAKEKIKQLGLPTLLQELLASFHELQEFHVAPIFRELGLDINGAAPGEGEPQPTDISQLVSDPEALETEELEIDEEMLEVDVTGEE